MNVAILGAGGHARVVLDCLQLAYGEKLVPWIYDDGLEREEVLGFPIRGPLEQYLEEGDSIREVFVAIGDNRRRRTLTHQMEENSKSFLTIVHPFSAISTYATLGPGTIAVAGTIANAGSSIGRGVILNTHCSVGHDCTVEDYVQIAPAVNLGGSAIIGEGAFLGIGVKVAPKVRVGAWTVVGGGSFVLHDLPPHTFCYGIPARVIRPLDGLIESE